MALKWHWGLHWGGIRGAMGQQWGGILMATMPPSPCASHPSPFAFAALVDAVARCTAARSANTSWRRQMGSDTCVCRRVFVVTLRLQIIKCSP